MGAFGIQNPPDHPGAGGAMRVTGVEPAHRKIPDPKGDVTLVMYCLQQSAVRARN